MAGKKERQRRLAREHFQRQQTRRRQRAQRRRQMGIIGSACALVVALGVGGYFALATGKPAASAAGHSHTPTATATPTASPTASAATVSEPASHCVYIPKPPAARKVGFPPAKPVTKTTYRATIVTNRGTIVLDLFGAKATCAVNSFAYLASKGYFNNTPCHRLTTSGIFVLQCGDPTGTGTGGPGYEFANENLAGARYTAGTVAMANEGPAAGPSTNGSQFFMVYKNSLTLPPDYPPFGRIVKGLGIIKNVAKAGTSNGTGDGHPKEKVTITSITITKA